MERRQQGNACVHSVESGAGLGNGSALLIASEEMEIAPTGDDELRLSEEIADSVAFIAANGVGRAKGQRLENRDPERAGTIIALLCRGVPHRTIIEQTGVNSKSLQRLQHDHAEVIASTKHSRAVQATRLSLKAADALEKKLEDVLHDDEVRAKTTVKDLAMGFGITFDKKQALDGVSTVITHEHKVTLEDARAAIEAAKQEVIDV